VAPASSKQPEASVSRQTTREGRDLEAPPLGRDPHSLGSLAPFFEALEQASADTGLVFRTDEYLAPYTTWVSPPRPAGGPPPAAPREPPNRSPALRPPMRPPPSRPSPQGTGGPARFFAEARTKDQVRAALAAASAHGVRAHVLGRGSNTLFDDRGFPGLVLLNRVDHEAVQLGGQSREGEGVPGDARLVVAGGGCRLNALAWRWSERGWGGLEFAVGIPGTVGGAAFANAGAHGRSMADVVESVSVCTSSGEIVRLSGEHLGFGYRSSVLSGFDSPCVVVEATLRLNRDEGALARACEWLAARNQSQPVAGRSAGCAFRNPPGDAAGRLIDACRLKGARVGAAAVSEVHANFVVNEGAATSADILALLGLVEARVRQETGVALEREVVVVPWGGGPRVG